MVFLEGDPIQSYELLREALNERNYFLQCAPYLNREIKLLIPHKSFFLAAFYYYPATLMYHLVYLKELAKTNYVTTISGPKIYTKSKIKKEFPDIEPIK